MSRWFGLGGCAGACPGPDGLGACGDDVGTGAPPGPVDPGRALSIRFRRDIDYFPSGPMAEVNGR
jgi:hypothetical protein